MVQQMKSSGHFIYITLNCIAVAIATGLVTVIMLIAVVLLINHQTTTAAINTVSRPGNEVRSTCLVYYNNTSINHDTRPG